MLKECRCGRCKRLLARMGEFTELQIKCSRCGTLNHMKATSLEPSPVSDMNAMFRYPAFDSIGKKSWNQ
ncbi:Com family DNA-binding transcriptional regulator [Pseudomonas qingdaonensis]|uniref:Com family DNA-binding transcriptional regulator n=1 Tax=Pseudomonas qingdaonensis TaxID=2056231 RepID=UPI0028A94704|nr:Com family DNA-binding transcriptional regulator [Pseudomonas qingdaonensis]